MREKRGVSSVFVLCAQEHAPTCNETFGNDSTFGMPSRTLLPLGARHSPHPQPRQPAQPRSETGEVILSFVRTFAFSGSASGLVGDTHQRVRGGAMRCDMFVLSKTG